LLEEKDAEVVKAQTEGNVRISKGWKDEEAKREMN